MSSALETLNLWKNACLANSGSESVWHQTMKSGQELRTFSFQQSKRDHGDGALTGYIFRTLDGTPTKIGQFRIEGNGEVTLAPKFLKLASTSASTASAAALTEAAPATEASASPAEPTPFQDDAEATAEVESLLNQ